MQPVHMGREIDTEIVTQSLEICHIDTLSLYIYIIACIVRSSVKKADIRSDIYLIRGWVLHRDTLSPGFFFPALLCDILNIVIF